ncbi:unnamed protein product [Didymodactylos carnosus]|uniref:Uncharacterized protein n=1 Tax=Didymodactylos carnosus TaxID=1234261 RepID=A0A815GUW0_9BILA|nr:unnamed protein product [Didymodactylos carnosus]CAF4206232.1 unnamed protein product [Didymodactylos carnosus]
MLKELSNLIPGCYGQDDRQTKKFITDKLLLFMPLGSNTSSEITRLFEELKHSDHHFKDNVSVLLTFNGSRVSSKEIFSESQERFNEMWNNIEITDKLELESGSQLKKLTERLNFYETHVVLDNLISSIRDLIEGKMNTQYLLKQEKVKLEHRTLLAQSVHFVMNPNMLLKRTPNEMNNFVKRITIMLSKNVVIGNIVISSYVRPSLNNFDDNIFRNCFRYPLANGSTLDISEENCVKRIVDKKTTGRENISSFEKNDKAV